MNVEYTDDEREELKRLLQTRGWDFSVWKETVTGSFDFNNISETNDTIKARIEYGSKPRMRILDKDGKCIYDSEIPNIEKLDEHYKAILDNIVRKSNE